MANMRLNINNDKYEKEIKKWLKGVRYRDLELMIFNKILHVDFKILNEMYLDILIKNMEPIVDELKMNDTMNADDYHILMEIEVVDFDSYLRKKGLQNLIDSI